VVADHRPVLCAVCHASNALPGTGIDGIPPLTAAVHTLHAQVLDPSRSFRWKRPTTDPPATGVIRLRDTVPERRHGTRVAPDGTMSMQCQSCHGTMSVVGGTRSGWLDQPACQNCHTGTARHNNGSIRYTTAFSAPGSTARPSMAPSRRTRTCRRQGCPVPVLEGHGGLACEACHGSTHAEYPSAHDNDNVRAARSRDTRGSSPTAGRATRQNPSTVRGGPHGMHPIGQGWVNEHGDVAEDGGAAPCADCHGTNFRGTPLSYTLGPRTLNAFGTRTFWQGFQSGATTATGDPAARIPRIRTAPPGPRAVPCRRHPEARGSYCFRRATRTATR